MALNKYKSWLDFSNYVAKSKIKEATGVDTSEFGKKYVLVNKKKPDGEEFYINKLQNVPTNLNSLELDLDKLDAFKLSQAEPKPIFL